MCHDFGLKNIIVIYIFCGSLGTMQWIYVNNYMSRKHRKDKEDERVGKWYLNIYRNCATIFIRFMSFCMTVVGLESGIGWVENIVHKKNTPFIITIACINAIILSQRKWTHYLWTHSDCFESVWSTCSVLLLWNKNTTNDVIKTRPNDVRLTAKYAGPTVSRVPDLC